MVLTHASTSLDNVQTDVHIMSADRPCQTRAKLRVVVFLPVIAGIAQLGERTTEVQFKEHFLCYRTVTSSILVDGNLFAFPPLLPEEAAAPGKPFYIAPQRVIYPSASKDNIRWLCRHLTVACGNGRIVRARVAF